MIPVVPVDLKKALPAVRIRKGIGGTLGVPDGSGPGSGPRTGGKTGAAFINPDGTFKGGFEGCVRYQTEIRGLSDEAARRLCAEAGEGPRKTKSLTLVVRVEKARKLHYRTEFQGLPISIENRKGSVRRWYDPLEDRSGETKMRHPYGYIRLTEAEDGDHVDCYIGDSEDSRRVFIVRQQDPQKKTYDEDKVMLGFDSPAEAKRAYLAHYDNPGFFGSMDEVSMETFRAMLEDNHENGGRLKTKPGRVQKSNLDPRDEAAWQRAKSVVRKQYPEKSEDDPSFWKLVQTVFQQVKSRKHRSGKG